jgi:hypothetical protein
MKSEFSTGSKLLVIVGVVTFIILASVGISKFFFSGPYPGYSGTGQATPTPNQEVRK